MSIQEINAKLSLISRLVVHPKYRTVGLGATLIRETLPLAGTQFVELIAVMPKYSPFAEKAGMKRVAQQESVKSVAKLSQQLETLGFDLQFLGSKHYVKTVIEGLDPAKLAQLREAFLHNKHPRFRTQFASFGRRLPFFTKEQWTEAIKTADLEKLAALIRVVGILLQKKVYLFWENVRP